MSPKQDIPLVMAGTNDRQSLLEQMASVEIRPFAHQVVESPWHNVQDVDALHSQVKKRIRELVDTCEMSEATRCLTVLAPAGYGKTHLLAWTRQMVEESDSAVFVFVPPYAPENGPLELQVLLAALDALRLRSRRQAQLFKEAVLHFLVQNYDHIIRHGSLKDLLSLRAGSWLKCWLRRASLKIGDKTESEQLAALQEAFERRFFLQRAFAEFREQHHSPADGVRPDWDTFAAAALLTCGNTQQRRHVTRWFNNELMPLEVRQVCYLDNVCEGAGKVRNALFTLNRLVGQVFCLAFDQMEDTHLAIERAGQNSRQLGDELSNLLRGLMATPRFCLLFMFQVSIWEEFGRKAPKQLVERMVAGAGPEYLPDLDDLSAQEVIRSRLAALIWKPLDLQPPSDEPCFPFSAEEIRVARITSGSELRSVLQWARKRYEELLNAPSERIKPPPLRLLSINPEQVMSHEAVPVLIRAENIPLNVKVFFASQQAAKVTCRPKQGEIDATTPTELLGEVEVRVQDVTDATNAHALTLRFVEKEIELVARPYRDTVSGKLLKKRRNELGLTQGNVADALGIVRQYVSDIELERGKPYLVDEMYERLAEYYERPLSDFKKQ